MSFKGFCAAAALAVGLGGSAAAQQAAVGATPVPTGDDKEVMITGCVVRGDDGGYVLSTVGEAVTVQTSRTTVGTSGTTTTTTTTTTSPNPAIPPEGRRIIYWLDDDDDLIEAHAGQRVEVQGKIEGDIDRGEIEVERENDMIELEIKAKGEKITVKLPDTPAANNSAVGTSGTVTDKPKDVPFAVRKFDVKKVKMIAPSCM